MFFLPLIAAIGIGLGAVGTVVQMKAQASAAKAAEKAEKLRERQMNLDAQRQKRKIIRESIMQRSIAVANATNQGAGDSSGLEGGIAQVTGEAASGLAYTGKSQQIGAGIFQANADAAKAQGRAAFGSGLSSLGGAIVDNAGTINRLGQ